MVINVIFLLILREISMGSPKVSWTRGSVPSVPCGNWAAARSRKKEQQTEALCHPLQVLGEKCQKERNCKPRWEKAVVVSWYLLSSYVHCLIM